MNHLRRQIIPLRLALTIGGYDTPYIQEVLKRHKAVLRERGVQMGINVVDASLGDQEELFSEGGTLKQ